MNDTSGRWSYARQLYGHVYTAKIGTLSELVTAGDQFNQQHITLAGYEKETQTPADELAASRTARAAVFIRNDPARPTQTGELVGMLPAPKGKRFTMTEQQTLLSHGVATAYVESGVLRIQRDVTTYRKNSYGVADNSYLDSETLHTSAYVLRKLKSVITSKYGRHKLASDGKRTGVLKAIFGDDAETLQVVNALIDKGKDGYDQIQQKMNKQASLNKRVQAQLGTLSNLWEAMTGTATNGLAAIGGAFSGDAKNITQWLGELGEKFTKFADENPRVIRGVVGLAAGLAILKLGLMGVGSAISIVSRIMSMTPIGMIATAIALAAGLIITNWDVVGPYFKKLWETIGPYFEAGWELLKKVFAWSPLGMVIKNWGPVVKWFQDMWDKLKPIIEWFTDSSGDTVDAINSAQWGAGAYDAYGTGIPARGYTPYPAVDLAQSNNASDATGPNPFMINKASAPKVDGEIKVSFINMPPGMRVTETRSSGIDINHDVGYTRFW